MPNSATPSVHLIDARGLKCPLPVLKTEKAASTLPPGTLVEVRATDPMARIDLPVFCRQQGYAFELREEEAAMIFTITLGGAKENGPR
ncbi:sulfurtransferase TusA family protein [Arsenicitalea aurantiaca]|uniref:sulfurtransferase TusA family protein n=1 Tax=Arsenicitalea aurantiaca TaxID=1783274 RepID=UPI001FCE4FEA|nr:sulfurtransferase TusA family protein [Arsenicitalea aurantiaca]